jgi:hypothetical protein
MVRKERVDEPRQAQCNHRQYERNYRMSPNAFHGEVEKSEQNAPKPCETTDRLTISILWVLKNDFHSKSPARPVGH